RLRRGAAGLARLSGLLRGPALLGALPLGGARGRGQGLGAARGGAGRGRRSGATRAAHRSAATPLERALRGRVDESGAGSYTARSEGQAAARLSPPGWISIPGTSGSAARCLRGDSR